MSRNYMSRKIIWVEIIWIEIIWNAIIWVEIIWNVTEPFFAIWLLNVMDIQLILESKINLKKFHLVCPKNS